MIVSAELGDFESDVHSPGVISEFRFHPEQDEKMEEDVLEKFKELGWVDCDFQATQNWRLFVLIWYVSFKCVHIL